MLIKWLPKTPSKIPRYCTTFTAACGVVIDLKNEEILLIKEKYQEFQDQTYEPWVRFLLIHF